MEKEKRMYVKLPDGAEYQKVEVTEDNSICIVYTEKCVSSEEVIKKTVIVSIPKPIPLIGGTEVYQKENGTPYWYCRIKDGRDEFMHVYFGDLTENDLLYDANGHKREFVTDEQKNFKADVLKALENKPKEGFRWLPVYEPSKDEKANLQYVAGVEVLRNLTSRNWENLFSLYSIENGSRLASITTYFLLALRWLKDGVATIEQLADNSKDIGNYCNDKNVKCHFEKTGERKFGGLYGFVGNTYKIVKDSESSSGFSLVGGGYDNYGGVYPFAYVYHDSYPFSTKVNGVGLLELTK